MDDWMTLLNNDDKRHCNLVLLVLASKCIPTLGCNHKETLPKKPVWKILPLSWGTSWFPVKGVAPEAANHRVLEHETTRFEPDLGQHFFVGPMKRWTPGGSSRAQGTQWHWGFHQLLFEPSQLLEYAIYVLMYTYIHIMYVLLRYHILLIYSQL